MLIEIPQVLDDAGVARLRAVIDGGEWVDGNVTSGSQAALAKRNEQLAEGSPAAIEGGAVVLEALTGIRRAGADLVVTYHAKDAAAWLQR